LDLVKVGIFIGVFLVLFLLARRLSSGESVIVQASQPPPPDGLPDHPEDQARWVPAVVGSDLPFPIPLPPITRSPDGLYSRPKVLNYYFAKIDLVEGPADPTSFSDEFCIELESPADGHTWTARYLVATPEGLQQELESQTSSALYLNGATIVVARWDVAAVLQAVMKEIMEHWAHSDADESADDAGHIPDSHDA
jgi:hypothetical protein